MAKFAFKSSGINVSDRANVISSLTGSLKIPPIGIKTPLRLGNDSEGFLGMTYDISEEFSDNLRNLIMTNWGERVGLYDFGADLRPICTEFVTQDDFDTEAINRIKKAVEKWMPYVELIDFSSSTDHFENKNTAIRKINVTYKIPSINDIERAIQVILYVI